MMWLQVALGRAFLALGHTWRVRRSGVEHVEAARRESPQGNVIYALWHGLLTILTYTHRDRDVQVLVSQHRDGELIARIVATLGYGLVRGSSRRGGREALFGLAKQLDAGRDVAITVDGPTGPRYRVQAGAVLLARRSGCPIVPVSATASPCTFVPSWDAHRVPHPFARVHVHYSAPIWPSAESRIATATESARRLEVTMRRDIVELENQNGRDLDLRDLQDRRSYWERVSAGLDPPRTLRALAAVHGTARRLERRLRPRPAGLAARPWVIGIGNLEAGGTGKTPCVLVLAQALEARGLRVGVLTRGHRGALGRHHPVLFDASVAADASDETRLLAAKLPSGCPLVVARNKRRGLMLLGARSELDVVVVDDAFQTAGLPVDRHLVLLDWERPLGNGHLLPAGRLREPPDALRRAHALLFTRARDGGLPRHPAWAHLPPERCFMAREDATGLVTVAGEPVDAATLRGRGIALLSGLGRPEAFEQAASTFATRHALDVRRIVRVGDHAPIDAAIRRLARKLDAIGAAHIVTTAKDVARATERTRHEPLLVLEQRLVMESLPDLLRVLLPRSTRLRSPRSSRRSTQGC